MIESLYIQNFQSHEKSKLEFSPGLNVIVGSSDCGKTAIIRAFRWVLRNRPSGDAIRSNWGGDTCCLVKTKEGSVLRFKGKEDRYELKIGEQKSVLFKAFGTTVPEEISVFLNVNEVNLQAQHDSPFLISETPGAVAAHFNKVAHLDKIDIATGKINSWIRGLKSDIEYTTSEIESEKIKLQAFDHLDKFESELEVLETLSAKLSGLRTTKESLRKDIHKYKELSSTIEEYEDYVKWEPLVDSVLDLISKQSKEKEKYNNLFKIINNLKEIEEVENSINHLLEAEPLVDDMINKISQVEAIQSDYIKLKSIIDQTHQCQSDIITIETNIKELEKRFHKEIGDICPLCDSILKK